MGESELQDGVGVLFAFIGLLGEAGALGAHDEL